METFLFQNDCVVVVWAIEAVTGVFPLDSTHPITGEDMLPIAREEDKVAQKISIKDIFWHTVMLLYSEFKNKSMNTNCFEAEWNLCPC